MYSKTIEDVMKYISEVEDGYDRDPADTDFQEGYLQGILVLKEWLTD